MHVQEETKTSMPLLGIAPYAGTFGKDELTHLLKRTMFGVKKADVDFFAGKTLSQVVDTLLTPTIDPTPPINNYGLNSKQDVDRIALGQVWAYDSENGNYNGQRSNSLRAWWVGNMINQNRSIHEKMILFWHNHFATRINDTSALYFFQHLTVLRRNALGNFKTFVKEITLDPNMLRFLNGYRNVKTAPDENYGRELQELFTVGKGPNSKYTENDVKAAAKVLTGWDVKQETFRNNPSNLSEPLKTRWVSYFKPTSHDVTNKIFSAFYKNTIIKGDATALGGANEIDALIAMLLGTDESAKFLVRKFYRFFVYYAIDATVESEVITPLATIFRQSYDIKAVLKALFSSQHFFDTANRNAMIKSPIDLLVGLVREFNTEFPASTDYVTQYNAWNQIISNGYGADQQGQVLGNPPNVAGWPAYYQEPNYHEIWINTDTFPKRLRFTDQFFTVGGFGLGNSKKIYGNVLAFTDQFGTDAADPNLLVTRVLEAMYRVSVSDTFKAYLKKTILLDGQASDRYWTDAWNTYKNAPTMAATNTVVTRLTKLYKFLTENPEYQLS